MISCSSEAFYVLVFFPAPSDISLLFFFLILLHEQVKQKQQGVKRMMLPSVEGEGGGKWIVVDSGMF